MSVTQRTPPAGVYLSTSQRPSGGGRARLLLVALVLVAALAGVAIGAFWLSERGTLPARTEIGGVDVGGKSTADARRLVARASPALVRHAVQLRFDGDSVRVTGSQLGASPRVAEAVEAAEGEGLFGRFARRLGFGTTRHVPLRFDLDPERLDVLGDELDQRIAAAPRDAVLRVTAAGTSVEPARQGRAVGRRILRARLRTLPASIAVPVAVVMPHVTTAAAEHARLTVDALLERPRTVALYTSKTVLTPQMLRRALVLEPEDGTLGVSLDHDVLRRQLGSAFRKIERPARDASFRIVGTAARVTPSRPGKELDVDRIARSLVNNLESTVHRARFRALAPTLTTEQAGALGIDEQVSEFTTYYPCCAPRVTNIQRAAQLLDGTILGRGETFSLNQALGRRTEENGFVTAPQIFDGRLEDAVGGGISQVATTMYNAAFFAGLRLDAHQAHQFYISRYPMGREATVSWGGPELIFTNDWDAGLLIKVSAWSTGISVRFFSSKLDRRIETVTEQPYGYKQPTTHRTKNPALKPGGTVVQQEAGGPGFTVEYTRKVYRGSKLLRDERFRVRYDPQDAFIEVGPPKKKPKPKPKPGEEADAPADGEPAPPTTPGGPPQASAPPS